MELVYKLDYFYERTSHLNNEQKKLCEKYIPERLKWKSILPQNISKYSWDNLISKSLEFFSKEVSVYDRIIDIVWRNKTEEDICNNCLIERPCPEGFQSLPESKKRKRNGNYDSEQDIENKIDGTAGEELVIELEKGNLLLLKKQKLANDVSKVKDSEGYDVLSFYPDANPKYIEVKTTKGDENTPFYLTENELQFSKTNSNYFIYRLFNYSKKTNFAEYFIIDNPGKKLLLKSIKYLAYYKKPAIKKHK